MTFIAVRHSIEVAHRLFLLEGNKCQRIHGHSMNVEMRIYGHIDKNGLLDGLDFGQVKKAFRAHLDVNYDHSLLLNKDDPWAGALYCKSGWYDGSPLEPEDFRRLPGLVAVPGDPTTENLAKWIAEWGANVFHMPVDVVVHETSTNSASTSARPLTGINQIQLKDVHSIGAADASNQ